MSAPHPALDHLFAPPQRRVRIRHPWGHGNWFDTNEADSLLASCTSLNARHGAGTHRLEWE